MMALLSQVDQYCERTGFDFFNEPLNAATNLAFFLAAWLLYAQYKKRNMRDKEVHTLIILIAIIGAGSLAFHTFANYAAMVGDVIPIMFFVFYFLWVALRSLLGVSNRTCFFLLLAFFGLSYATGMVPAEYSFNGSVGYFPCLAALIAVGFALKHKTHPGASLFFKASALFIVSLTFRTMDASICASIPIGTHFIWHMLNGTVLYTLTRAVLDHKAKVN